MIILFKEYACVMQQSTKDCGVSCLLTIIKTYGGSVSLEYLRELTRTTNEGTNAFLMINAMNKLGFDSKAVSGSINDLKTDMFPCIAHVLTEDNIGHFIVIHKFDSKRKILTIADPAVGRRLMPYSEFIGITTNVFLLFTPIKTIPKIEHKSNLIESVIYILSKYKNIFISIFLFSLICVFINIITSFQLQFIIDNVISVNSENNLKFIIILLLFLYLIKNINIYIRDSMLNYINHELDFSLIGDVFKHIISLPYLYYKSRTSGEVISRITDLSEIRDVISNIFITIFVDLILAVFVFLSLLSINSKLTFICVCIIILYFLVVFLFDFYVKKNVRILKENGALINSNLYEYVNSVETIKGLSLEDKINDRFTIKYNKYLNHSFKFNQTLLKEDFLKNVLDFMCILVINYFGTIYVMSDSMKLSELITFNSLIYYFNEPIKNVINFNLNINKVRETIRRVDEMLSIKSEELTVDCKYTNNEIINDINIKDLNYTYDNRRNILKGVNLSIKKGDRVLITGDSGCGKSTLVKLLLKYFTVDNGHIYFNDKDINYFNLKELRERFSYVSQSEFLYNDSLYNNVTLDHYVDYNSFLKICNITKVIDIINNNPVGASFRIEENGFNLSGGERQRVILARSLLKDSDVYIFDESLSQIDIETEREILKNIFSIYSDKTFLVISHRLDNDDLYNRHISLKDGIIYD